MLSGEGNTVKKNN